MAVAFDAITDGNVAGNTTITVNHTMGAGANGVIYAILLWRKTTTKPSSPGCTWNGSAMTYVGTSDSLNRGIFLWRTIAPTSGAHDCVASWTNSTNAVLVVVSYTGVSQTAPEGTLVTAGDNTNNPTCTVPSAADQIVMDAVIMDTGVLTEGAGQTKRSSESATTANTATSTQTGEASTVMDWSSSTSDNWRVLAFAILPPSLGGEMVIWSEE